MIGQKLTPLSSNPSCKTCSRAVLLGFLTLPLSVRAPFPEKSLTLSIHVSSGNLFLSVQQEPTLWPWKGSPFLWQYRLSVLDGAEPRDQRVLSVPHCLFMAQQRFIYQTLAFPSSCCQLKTPQPKNWELCLCWLKKYPQLKADSYYVWWEFFGLQARETASQVTLRELLWGGKRRSQVI